MQDKQHEVENVTFEKDILSLKVDGKRHAFQLSEISPRLLHADIQTRESFSISPSGYGIYWERVDEDLSIDGLLGIQHKPHRKTELSSVAEPNLDYGS